jgi:hypothetical protein
MASARAGFRTNRGPLQPEFLTMYKPNFCAECGEQIIRARWHIWTSKRFCSECGRRLRSLRATVPLLAGVVVFSVGLIAGRALRPAPPPMVLIQGQTSGTPVTKNSPDAKPSSEPRPVYGPDGTANERPTEADEVVSICGARTKKDTPCSRRVRGTGRCWQHKGMPAMLPPAKLIVEGNN